MTTEVDETRAKSCPECHSPMAPIVLLDKAGEYGGMHQLPEYALAGSTPSYWLRKFPIAGHVSAHMCSQCGRINLYGVSNQQS